MYKTLTGITTKRISKQLAEQNLLPAQKNNVNLEVNVTGINY
jgi:hypothetical protein